MTGINTAANRLIASKFPWKNYRTAADVGTAQGDLIVQVALANPHISGIGFDLAEVAPTFEEYVAANGLSSRVAFCAGSFLEGDLPKADVVMLGTSFTTGASKKRKCWWERPLQQSLREAH